MATTVEQGILECGVIRDDDGELFLALSIQNSDLEIIVPPVVLDYRSVQELIGVMADYLIEAEESYES